MNDQDPHQAEVADLTAELKRVEGDRDLLRREANKMDKLARTARKRIAELRSDPESAARMRCATLRGPVATKRLEKAKDQDVEYISVAEPWDYPGAVTVFVHLVGGRGLTLTMTPEDAYKLERRLAWRLQEIQKRTEGKTT